MTVVDDLATDEDLVEAAAKLLNPHLIGDRVSGDVASVLVTSTGDHFGGVCIDTSSGTGFCAEHAAIAAMVTARQHRIARIVAVWRDDEGTLYVLPPCGRCREFIRQVHPENTDTRVILGRGTSAALRELLPKSDWPDPY
jgi:cytidine deaminase